MKRMRICLAMLLLPLATGVWAQDSAEGVEVALEAYLVNIVTHDDGTETEAFIEADAARPGQMVEYRVLVHNTSQETMPAEAVVITGPVPAQTFYLEASATPSSEVVRTEFSADGGASYSQPPLMAIVTDADGGEREVLVDPADYTSVRWTLLEPLGPQESRTFVYRAEVR